MTDQSLGLIYISILVAMVLLLAFGIFRGRRIIAANERIVQGQREVIELTRRATEANERQAAALDRIAVFLEKRTPDA